LRLKIRALLASATLVSAGCVVADSQPTVTGDYLSGRLAAKQNAVDEAAKAYAEAYADAPGQISILRSAFFYKLAAGDIEQAAPLAAKLLISDDGDDDGLARVALAAVKLKNGDYLAARDYLEGAYDAPFLKSASYLTNVWIEGELAGPEAAIAKLKSAPDDMFKGFNPLHAALLYEKAGNADEARTTHQVSVFGLGGPVGRAAYGAFLERAGDEAAAIEYYKLLIRERGAARRASQAGLARIEKGDASDKYADVTATQGAAIAFYSFGGAILEQTVGERTRAEEAGFNVGEPRYNLPLALSQIAIYLDPDLHDARSLVGQIFNVYSDFEAAAETLSAIPSSSPLFEQSRIYIAGGLAARDDADQAIALLQDTVSRDRNAVEAQFALANLYASDGRHQQTVSMVTTIIDDLGDDPEEDAWRYYITRGSALIELDQWEAAEADLEKAVEIAPEEATTLNYLGYSWAERGLNLDKAFELIEKAVELEPASGAITDSLGWAYYQRGDYKEAVTHLEKAASMEPSDPTITDHLGDVYWRLDRAIEARYQWRRVIELEPDEKLEKQVEEKLKEGLKETDTVK